MTGSGFPFALSLCQEGAREYPFFGGEVRVCNDYLLVVQDESDILSDGAAAATAASRWQPALGGGRAKGFASGASPSTAVAASAGGIVFEMPLSPLATCERRDLCVVAISQPRDANRRINTDRAVVVELMHAADAVLLQRRVEQAKEIAVEVDRCRELQSIAAIFASHLGSSAAAAIADAPDHTSEWRRQRRRSRSPSSSPSSSSSSLSSSASTPKAAERRPPESRAAVKTPMRTTKLPGDGRRASTHAMRQGWTSQHPPSRERRAQISSSSAADVPLEWRLRSGAFAGGGSACCGVDGREGAAGLWSFGDGPRPRDDANNNNDARPGRGQRPSPSSELPPHHYPQPSDFRAHVGIDDDVAADGIARAAESSPVRVLQWAPSVQRGIRGGAAGGLVGYPASSSAVAAATQGGILYDGGDATAARLHSTMAGAHRLLGELEAARRAERASAEALWQRAAGGDQRRDSSPPEHGSSPDARRRAPSALKPTAVSATKGAPRLSPEQVERGNAFTGSKVVCPWCRSMMPPAHPARCPERAVQCKRCGAKLTMKGREAHRRVCPARPS